MGFGSGGSDKLGPTSAENGSGGKAVSLLASTGTHGNVLVR